MFAHEGRHPWDRNCLHTLWLLYLTDAWACLEGESVERLRPTEPVGVGTAGGARRVANRRELTGSGGVVSESGPALRLSFPGRGDNEGFVPVWWALAEISQNDDSELVTVSCVGFGG